MRLECIEMESRTTEKHRELFGAVSQWLLGNPPQIE